MNRCVLMAWGVAALAWAVVACGCDRPRAGAESGTRIVALSPAAAVTLKDLGLADRIVGRHGYDLALDPGVAVCGDQAGIDYEALLAVKPTHVVVQWGARDLPPRLVRLAAERGWRVEPFNPLTLGEIRTSVDRLAELFDEPAVRQRAAELRAACGRAWSKRPGVDRAGRVLLLVGVKPPAALGPGSFHQQILEALGGTAAVKSGGAYQELDAEDVLHLKPEAIVIFRPRRFGAPAAEPGWPSDLGALAGLAVPALEKRRVAVIDDPLGLTPSTAMIGLADELAGVLERWARE